RLGHGSYVGRTARLPQRAGDRDRADRHHRPGDGLRHHRHRARLRAGQVQEARGRRLLKIINRAVPEALRVLGYSESEIAEIEVYALGHGTLSQAPAINHSTLKAKGFTDEAIA